MHGSYYRLPNSDVLDVCAMVIDAQSGIPVTEQVISFDGRRLDEPKARISQLGVTQNSILSLQRRAQKLSVVTSVALSLGTN